MISIKKTLYKTIQALPHGGTKDSWVYVKFNGYMICGQLFNLTPTAAKTGTTRTVTLPFAVDVSGGTQASYPLVTLLNSKPEIDTCIISGSRGQTSTTVDLYIYASNTTTRSVACVVFARLA